MFSHEQDWCYGTYQNETKASLDLLNKYLLKIILLTTVLHLQLQILLSVEGGVPCYRIL